MMSLLWLMLKEEFRMHASYSNKYVFLSFPALTMLFSLGFALTLSKMPELIPLDQMVMMLHGSVFLYGISVGAFGFMGRIYLERQQGQRNFIVTSPAILPISLKSTFLGMFLRDVIFYTALFLAPMAFGLLLSSPLTQYRPISILFLFVGSFLTFLAGISLSFFASTLYVRSARAFTTFLVALILSFPALTIVNISPAGYLVPAMSLQFQLPPFQKASDSSIFAQAAIALAIVLLQTALAVLLVRDTFEFRSSKFSDELPRLEGSLRRFGRYSTLLAKEMIDLKRSGSLPKMFFAFLVPLIFLGFTVWLIHYGFHIPIGFNAVFYGAMVGFFGVMLYNWLNNVDMMDSLSSLPLTVPEVIRTKLLAFFMLTSWISGAFLVVISWLNGDIDLLWLALVVMLIVSGYMVVMTAYLTGLRTNTFLFDPVVLAKFSAMAILPDLSLAILSFTIDKDIAIAAMGMGVVLASMAISTAILYKGIEEKWKRASFAD